MKPLLQLAARYAAALNKHLAQASPASLAGARAVGRQTVRLGLATLDLAQAHAQALLDPKLSGKRPESAACLARRARAFFAEANAPVEESRPGAWQAKAEIKQLQANLHRRTRELAAAGRRFERGVVQRRVMEEAFKASRQGYRKCLDESFQLQKRLRLLTHRALATQEDERKSISHELQDEIAQTLLGLNTRLLLLRREARGRSQKFKNDLAGTQRLVVKSAAAVHRAASPT